MKGKALHRVSTVGMSREEWLERRRGSIGGSDAAAIAGLSAYSSPYTVWADKTGLLPPKPDNEAMRQGRDLEGYAAKRWREETGKRVRRENAMLYHKAYPFAHADIDRWVLGENAGLECKTTSVLNLKKFKQGRYPESYYAQCVHYMAVTGADRWYLGVLVLGQGFYPFTIERDEEEISALMEQEAAFWAYVQAGTPPPADGHPATTEALGGVYQTGGDTMTAALFGREGLLCQYLALKARQQETARQMEQIKQTVMTDMGHCEKGACGGFSVSWSPRARRTFDAKQFLMDHPEIDASGYWKESSYRQFTIKEE